MDTSIAVFVAGLLVFVSAAVQHANTVTANGLAFVFSDRSQATSRDGFAGRAERTLRNNMESFAMVTPPALLLLANGPWSAVTGIAALVYAGVRIGFTLSYWAGVNRARSGFWAVGMGMIALLYVAAALRLLGFGG